MPEVEQPPPERGEPEGPPAEPPESETAPVHRERPTPVPVPESEEPWETRFRYLFADFENFRKRTERDRSRDLREGKARLFSRLLPLYEAAMKAREAVRSLPARDPVRKGVELLVDEWEKLLAAEAVEPVARSGSTFNEESMEAVAEAPASSAHPPGTVVEIVQQGYRMEDGLLRPAKVVVARPPAPAASARPDDHEPSRAEPEP